MKRSTMLFGLALLVLGSTGVWHARITFAKSPSTASGVSSSGASAGMVILGRPTDRSVTANVLASTDLQVYLEYGPQSGVYLGQTPVANLSASQPLEVVPGQLQPDLLYYCRLRFKAASDTVFQADTDATFHTQRTPGSTFTFDIQGDSYPERMNTEFNADLYVRTLQTAATDRPDFYMTIGDDFSVDTLKVVNADVVRSLYVQQRSWLGLVGVPVFLVNGNHEQAALVNLDGTPNNVAVWAQTARNSLYSPPTVTSGVATTPMAPMASTRIVPAGANRSTS